MSHDNSFDNLTNWKGQIKWKYIEEKIKGKIERKLFEGKKFNEKSNDNKILLIQ